MKPQSWVRSAFWCGQPKADAEDGFVTAINHQLIPGLRALPGVRQARALWPRKREDNPPPVACQILVEFDSRAALDRMLMSDERRAFRKQVLAVIALFDGTLSHIDYEVGPE